MSTVTRFAMAVPAILSVAAAALALSACGAPQPNWRNTGESALHELDVPSGDVQEEVFGPVPWEEAKSHVQRMSADGWELVESHSAAPDFPDKVILTYRRQGEPARVVRRAPMR
jgi:hypothetical protein